MEAESGLSSHSVTEWEGIYRWLNYGCKGEWMDVTCVLVV